MAAKTFTLSNGAKMPSIGLGTWRSPNGQVRDAVRVALQAGYRHLDCAWRYGNETEVGLGIKDSGVPRKDIWITSKLWNSFHRPQHVQIGLEDTLRKLDTDYLDLMHWPIAFDTPQRDGMPPDQPQDKDGNTLVDHELSASPQITWKAMEKLHNQGLVSNLGISNFNRRRTKQLLEHASVAPVVNQCELHFGCAQPDFIKWSHDLGIQMQAYSPLASAGAPETQDPFIQKMAAKYDTKPANILISWQVARGVCPLPKSVTPERIRSNLELIDLKKEDVEAIEKEAASRPQQRLVPGGWGGVDIFEDAVDQP